MVHKNENILNGNVSCLTYVIMIVCTLVISPYHSTEAIQIRATDFIANKSDLVPDVKCDF